MGKMRRDRNGRWKFDVQDETTTMSRWRRGLEIILVSVPKTGRVLLAGLLVGSLCARLEVGGWLTWRSCVNEQG